MNRWRRWAAQLAARHGRREVSRPAQALTLAHPLVFSASHISIAAPSLHFHFRLNSGVVMRPPVAVSLLEHHRTFAAQGVAGSESRFVHAVPGNAPRILGAFSPAAPVTSQSTRLGPPPAIARQPLERRLERLHELVRMWSRKPETATEAASLPALVRQRSARHESSLPETARIFPAPARARTEADVSTTVPAAAVARRALAPEIPAPNARGVDVAALTSQVIQQLDRRLIAYQERMGRV